MEISIANRQRRIGVRSSRARMIASSVLERESACFDEISIAFLDDKAMQKLNWVFTGRDQPTDTLAFELTPEMGKDKPVPGIKLGEVIICVDRAIVQSRRYRVPLEKEVARLLIHGLLHLCGFEDGTKNGRARMHRREDFYLASLGEVVSALVASKRGGSKRGRVSRVAAGRGDSTSGRSRRVVSRRGDSTSARPDQTASIRKRSASHKYKTRSV
jgi:rRNA maturation RNase YbeY